jgi:predicted transcriptional regulator
VSRSILGTRIRERRRALGVTQIELSRRIGISASYLNLIERNKRGIAGPLLRRAASALDLALDELDGAAERRLLETLDEIAHAPEMAGLGVEAEGAGELIGRYPGWARALAALARSERAAATEARALADRLTHDPFLGETVHRMLSRIAAVRSAAEILVDYPDAVPAERDRFLGIVNDESRALSDVAEALAAYFDKAEEARRALTPLDEVEALYEARGNRFDEIEVAAAELSGALAEAGPRQEAARALAAERLAPAVDALIARQPELETAPARARARAALLEDAAGAILAPMPLFAPRAAALGYDVEALATEFGLEVDTVCRRLVALPGDSLPRFGYFRANAAGTLIERRGLAGLVTPRYAPACPLWVLFRAQQSPESVIRQRAIFPTGERFVFLARAHHTGPTGFGRPRHYLTDMLALTEADARLTVYAPDAGVPTEEVGPACRVCPRRACAHRVDDPLTG